jgi:hypothetical protein
VVLLLSALCAPAAGLALEPGWRGEFVATPGAPIDPKATLRIRLPEEVDPATMEWLSVELDSLDVTPILTLEGREIVVRPPRPLATGSHRLSLTQYREQGEPLDRGAWSFAVGQAIAYQVRADASLAATYRVDTSDVPQETLPAHTLTADGSLRLEGSAGTDAWQVSGTADGIYTSQPPEGVDSFQGGNYLATVRVGSVTGQVGQIDPQLDSAIIRSFQRRGASLGYASGGQQVQASAFALRAEPVIGFKEGLGIHDADNRVFGGALTLRPFGAHPAWLALTGIYLTGKQGADPGVAVVDQSAASEGSAWSLGFVSGLFNQRLRLKGEFASAKFDPDRTDETLAAKRDEAYGGAAVWDAVRDAKLGESPLSWTFGAEYQRNGASFKSIANAGIPTDLQLEKIFTRLGIGGLSGEVVLGREHDNVEGDAAVVTGQTDLVGATASYRPTLAAEGPALALLGQPQLDVGYQRLHDRTLDLPQGVSEQPERRTAEWSAGVGSSYRTWDWRAGYRSRREEDLAGAAADRTSSTLEGNLGLRPWERLTLGLRAQLVRDEDLGTSVERTGTLIGGDLTLVLVKERLTARGAYQSDSRTASDGTEDARTQTLDFNLDLTLRQPGGNLPGITVSLRGQRQDIADRVSAANDRQPFQLFLAVNLGWPAATAGTWR